MELPNFKDILSKLSVFRNKSLLIPLIIFVVGVLLFIPTWLIGRELKKEMQTESVSNGFTRVNNLLKNSVPEELLEIKTKQLETQAKDANEIELLAKQTTQRKLLSNDIFDVNDPNSIPGLTFLQFGQQYSGGIDKMIAAGRAGDSPAETEIERAIDESGVKNRVRLGMTGMEDGRSMIPDTRRMTMRRPGGTGGRTPWEGPGMMSEYEKIVIDQLCRKRAEQISFYVTPTQLSGYTFWKNYNINVQKTEAVEDCWYFQLAYWVIEDIFDTINSMNTGHENTLSSPFKRLVRLGFRIDTRSFSRISSAGRGPRGGSSSSNTEIDEENRPKYVLSSDKETMLAEPCTGRYSDDDIDVIHFNIVCVVSTKDMMAFMKELCSAKEHQYIDESGQTHTYKHNQITIIETKFNSIDKEDIDHMYYIYGDGGVVELDLICEYIFKKEGYEDLKPESVKQTLLGEEEE
jgi:hypothetical protein